MCAFTRFSQGPYVCLCLDIHRSILLLSVGHLGLVPIRDTKVTHTFLSNINKNLTGVTSASLGVNRIRKDTHKIPAVNGEL